MKTKLLLFLWSFGAFNVYAQNTNGVYVSNEDKVLLLEKPATRKVYGGTIINVKYVGRNISSTMKGAFEYACRLWEENIPTAYPINLTVGFGILNDPQCLATVEAESDGYNDDLDKIYTKRYAMAYGEDSTPLNPNNITLEYFRDSEDAEINFSSKHPFYYGTDATKIGSNQYDFITVALQAIGKAVGFTLKGYASGNTLNKLSPHNRYTSLVLNVTSTPENNYTKATSGEAYIEDKSSYPTKRCYLYSPSVYDSKRSLSYFQKDPTNIETLIMQPDIISKGSAVRYIGDGMQVFFSFCGWDWPMVSSLSGSSSHEEGSTDDVIPYQQISSEANAATLSSYSVEEDETINDYLSKRQESNADGNYVLLSDGSWIKYTGTVDPSKKDEYARTSDGYLRLKRISSSYGPNFNYRNLHITFRLADYIPQKPEAEMNSYTASDYSLKYVGQRTTSRSVQSDDEFVDVEIGFKNTEGCSEILVEQTDSDYPVPFFYYVDPSQGFFTAFMNKKYPSTFKLTYRNKNGETIGDPLTIDLTSSTQNVQDTQELHVTVNGNILHYEIENNSEAKEYTNSDLTGSYIISSIQSQMAKRQGKIRSMSGNIDISGMSKGLYVLVIRYANKTYSTKWIK